jgi:hypothetical protein
MNASFTIPTGCGLPGRKRINPSAPPPPKTIFPNAGDRLGVSLKIEQSQVGFLIVYFDQRFRPGGEKEFQGRPDIGFQHVSSPGFPTRQSHHAVNVNRRLTGHQADVAKHRAGFDLTVDRDIAKRLAVIVKPGKDSVLKRPDRADLSSLDIFVFGQFSQT